MSLDNEDLSSSATLIETANHGTPGHRKRDVEAITSHIHKTELGEIHRVPSPDWCWSRQTRPLFVPRWPVMPAHRLGRSTRPSILLLLSFLVGKFIRPRKFGCARRAGRCRYLSDGVAFALRLARDEVDGVGRDLTSRRWCGWCGCWWGFNLWNKASIPRFLQTAVSWPSSPPHFLHGQPRPLTNFTCSAAVKPRRN